jgi:hypothetical protein
MELEFNIFQEFFLVSYSILYGIMLQTYFGLNPFPWGKIWKNRERITGLRNETVQLVRWRLLFSIVFLNILPFVYAIGILWGLGSFNYESWELDCYLLMFLTFWEGWQFLVSRGCMES